MTDIFRVRLANIKAKRNNPFGEGAFHLREDILDQLDYYLERLKLVRKHDPDAYAYYARLGGSILPDSALLGASVEALLDHIVPSQYPTFSFVTLRSKNAPDASRVHPSFMYYIKHQRPGPLVNVASAQGHIFNLCMVYALHDADFFVNWHASASDNGIVRALPEFYPHYIKFRRDGVMRPTWQVPSVIKALANDNTRTVDEQSSAILALVASASLSAGTGYQVRAGRDGQWAAFNIGFDRTPYFFKDRDLHLNDKGTNKKIFHYVNGHMRSNGSYVRPHTKGLREFRWNGYDVNIVLPAFDAPNPSALVAGAIDQAHMPPDRGLTIDALSKVIQQHVLSASWQQRKRRNRRVARR